jgi:hypothetical protein
MDKQCGQNDTNRLNIKTIYTKRQKKSRKTHEMNDRQLKRYQKGPKVAHFQGINMAIVSYIYVFECVCVCVCVFFVSMYSAENLEDYD